MYIVNMSSIFRRVSQRDTRIENVILSGNISQNGRINGADIDQHPAYAAVDLRKSKNFTVNTDVLTLRTDDPPYDILGYMVNIYIDSSRPPLYYPNLEFNIIFTLKSAEKFFITIYENKQQAEELYSVSNKLYQITNEYTSDPGEYSSGTQIMTFQVVNNKIILKSLSPGLFA
jgi:hypothetical protein